MQREDSLPGANCETEVRLHKSGDGMHQGVHEQCPVVGTSAEFFLRT